MEYSIDIFALGIKKTKNFMTIICGTNSFNAVVLFRKFLYLGNIKNHDGK